MTRWGRVLSVCAGLAVGSLAVAAVPHPDHGEFEAYLQAPFQSAKSGGGRDFGLRFSFPDAPAGTVAIWTLELLDSAVEARRLDQCMHGLAPSQRQSLALAFFHGLSHGEVAEQLRQPLGTVKSWVRRGLLTLRACLDAAVAREAGGTPQHGR